MYLTPFVRKFLTARLTVYNPNMKPQKYLHNLK